MSWQNFMSRDVELLKTGLLADATITCGERTWKVHKSIIYRSEWFDKAFNGNFEVQFCANGYTMLQCRSTDMAVGV